MQLEERLEQEKIRSDKIRAQNEKNHVMRLQLLSKLENDYRLYNSGEEERKSFSENGKDLYNGPDDFHNKKDDQLYRFFTNSARNDEFGKTRILSKKSSLSPRNSNSKAPSEFELDVIPKVDCKNCGSMIDENKEGEIPDCFLCYWRTNREKKFCHNCWGHFKSIVDDYDWKPVQHERALDAHPHPHPHQHPKPLVVNRFDDKPYSMNLEPNSIFHPNYSEDIDQKFSNYAKNYGDLRRPQNQKIATNYPPKKFKKRPKKDTKIQKMHLRNVKDQNQEEMEMEGRRGSSREPDVLVQLGK
jgi:hypothetical protein